jgi:hypothetical protein
MVKHQKKPKGKSSKTKDKREKTCLYPFLQFRFWCTAGGGYICNYHYNGKVDELFESDGKLLIPEQCTGLRDKKKRWVYEGDILHINKSSLNKELLSLLGEIEKTTKKGWVKPKEKPPLEVTVERDPCEPSNLTLEFTHKSGLTAYLPLSLIKKSIVVDKKLKNKATKK